MLYVLFMPLQWKRTRLGHSFTSVTLHPANGMIEYRGIHNPEGDLEILYA